MSCACFSPAPVGRLHHAAGEVLARHCHRHGFAAVVLEGGYLEAGDRGRRTAAAGEVLIHQPFESHLNKMARRGAQVLVLPFAADNDVAPFAAAPDPDELVRLAETDPHMAAEVLRATMTALPDQAADWADLLAHDLRERAADSLQAWAEAMRLRPESVSRGFRAAYGVTPAGYRLTARARAAWSAVVSSAEPLAQIAAATGFADQAHMTRAVLRLTGRPPGHWRRAA